jgi:hypothetical protein
MSAAGEYYLGNAADTHAALEALGPLGNATSAALEMVEGENLNNALQPAAPAAGPGAGLPIAPGVPIAMPAAPNPNVAMNPPVAPNPPAGAGAQQFTQFVQQWAPAVIIIVGIASGLGAGGTPAPADPGDPLDLGNWGGDGAQAPIGSPSGQLLQLQNQAAGAQMMIDEAEEVGNAFDINFYGAMLESLTEDIADLQNMITGGGFGAGPN